MLFVRMFFRFPWPIHAIIAVGLFGLAAFAFMDLRQTEANKAAALAAPQPAAVSLNTFSAADIHLADEIHVLGQINPAYNYTLTEHHTGKRNYDVVRRMFVLFGPDDTADTKVARGVILLREDEVDAFADWALANASTFTDISAVFPISGEATTSPDLKGMAFEALGEQNLTRSPDFIFITPWVQGRAAGLAPQEDMVLTVPAVIAAPGLLAMILAIFGFRRARKSPGGKLAAQTAMMPTAFAAMPGPATASPLASPAMSNPAPKRKPIGQFILIGLFVIVVTKQYWVFGLLPFVILFGLKFGFRKGAALITEQITDIVSKNRIRLVMPPRTPAVQPAFVTTPQATASPIVVAKPAPKPMPPAIRPGFSFRDLLPKRREPAPQANPYANLAASIRDERLRRGGV